MRISKKPKFKIAEKIEKYKPKFHKDFHTYSIKIENESSHNITDIKFELRFRKDTEDNRITITYPLLKDNLIYLAPQQDKEDSYWNVTFTTSGIDGKEFNKKLMNIFPSEESLIKLIQNRDYDLRKLLEYFDHIQFLVKGTFNNKILVEKRKYKIEDIVDRD